MLSYWKRLHCRQILSSCSHSSLCLCARASALSAGRCIGGVCISRHDLTTRPGWRRLAGCCCRTRLRRSRRDSAFSPSTGSRLLSSRRGGDCRNQDHGRSLGSDGGQSLPPLPRLCLRYTAPQQDVAEPRTKVVNHTGKSNSSAQHTVQYTAVQVGSAIHAPLQCGGAPACGPPLPRLLLAAEHCCFGFSCSPLLGEPVVFPLLCQDSALACLPAPAHKARGETL